MLVLGVDTETTGLNFTEDWVIEIGYTLFDGCNWEPQEGESVLINRPEIFPIKAQEIHHISEEMVLKDGVGAIQAFNRLQTAALKADFIIAHNAQFDSQMLAENFKRTPGFEIHPDFLRKPWLCSKQDVKTHFDRRCTKLSHLAVDYGLMFDPTKLHRALDDVLLMGKVLSKAGLTAAEIKQWKDEPWVYLEALVEKPWLDNGRTRDMAKADGYSWEKAAGTSEPVFDKKWVKRIKQSSLDKEKEKKVGFKRVTLKV